MRFGLRAVLPAISVLLMNLAPVSAAVCPEGSLNGVDCTDMSGLEHAHTGHCSDIEGESEFAEYYCKSLSRLSRACTHASNRPANQEGLICYATGEEGEIVGSTRDGRPTDCYRVVFTEAGFGKVKLKTMYPVESRYCRPE